MAKNGALVQRWRGRGQRETADRREQQDRSWPELEQEDSPRRAEPALPMTGSALLGKERGTVLVLCCCMTNFPKTQGLNTANMVVSVFLWVRSLGRLSSGWVAGSWAAPSGQGWGWSLSGGLPAGMHGAGIPHVQGLRQGRGESQFLLRLWEVTHCQSHHVLSVRRGSGSPVHAQGLETQALMPGGRGV